MEVHGDDLSRDRSTPSIALIVTGNGPALRIETLYRKVDPFWTLTVSKTGDAKASMDRSDDWTLGSRMSKAEAPGPERFCVGNPREPRHHRDKDNRDHRDRQPARPSSSP